MDICSNVIKHGNNNIAHVRTFIQMLSIMAITFLHTKMFQCKVAPYTTGLCNIQLKISVPNYTA